LTLNLWNIYNNAPITYTEVTAGPNGEFIAAFPSTIPVGSARGVLTYFDASEDQVWLPFSAPYWEAELFSNYFKFFGLWQGAPLAVTLHAYSGAYSETVHVSAFGSYYTLVGFEHGLWPGDRLRIEYPGDVLTETLPLLRVWHDYQISAVRGTAPPGAWVLATFFGGFPSNQVGRRGQAGLDGSFGLDTSDLNLHLGDRGQVTYVDSHGNTTIHPFTVIGHRIYLPVIGK
jgi:hypothetical protein